MAQHLGVLKSHKKQFIVQPLHGQIEESKASGLADGISIYTLRPRMYGLGNHGNRRMVVPWLITSGNIRIRCTNHCFRLGMGRQLSKTIGIGTGCNPDKNSIMGCICWKLCWIDPPIWYDVDSNGLGCGFVIIDNPLPMVVILFS